MATGMNPRYQRDTHQGVFFSDGKSADDPDHVEAFIETDIHLDPTLWQIEQHDDDASVMIEYVRVEEEDT